MSRSERLGGYCPFLLQKNIRQLRAVLARPVLQHRRKRLVAAMPSPDGLGGGPVPLDPTCQVVSKGQPLVPAE